jgi:hypothetical protein
MATVTSYPTARKASHVTHYAYLEDVYSTAELLNGSGYLFRAEGERKTTLVSYRAPRLVLLGHCDLADAQRADDDAVGGLAALVCDYGKGH